jgi:disulfide bond formation protein DsbB
MMSDEMETAVTGGEVSRAVQIVAKYGLLFGFLVALVATLGSLYFSEIRRFIPCTLCWYQRILMYPLVVIFIVGLIERDRILPNYVLPFSLVGILVSGYHYALQNSVFSNAQTCTIGIPCTVRYVNYLGFITIPFMALTAFTLISVAMFAVIWARRRQSGAAED